MKKRTKLLTTGQLIELEKRLSTIPEVARFDVPGEPQAHTIAHALDGWEDSFSEVLDVLVPKLIDARIASAEDLNDILHEIGDQLRHIVYHIRDTKYFGYLLDDEP